mgnify:CR=1 FL=1
MKKKGIIVMNSSRKEMREFMEKSEWKQKIESLQWRMVNEFIDYKTNKDREKYNEDSFISYDGILNENSRWLEEFGRNNQ